MSNSGCRWQEKSFNVLMSNDGVTTCSGCGCKLIEITYKHNGDILCKDCFGKTSISRLDMGGCFNTHKDLTYNFVTDAFDGKPIQINSQRQYKRLLKQHRIADASIKECRQEADFRKKLNEESHNENIKKQAMDIFIKNRERIKYGGRK